MDTKTSKVCESRTDAKIKCLFLGSNCAGCNGLIKY